MSPEVITAIAVAVLGGGFITGIALLLKVRPEAGQVVVKSAESVVIMQKGLIDDLLARVDQATQEISVLRDIVEQQGRRLDEQSDELASTRSQRDRLLRENAGLKDEVHELRERVAQLERSNGGTP